MLGSVMDSRWKDEVLGTTLGKTVSDPQGQSTQGQSTQDQPQGQLQGGPQDLSVLVNLVHQLVDHARGDAIGLLDVLRLLERLHREVTEDAFQESLPSNRQELYKLLRVMDEEGGWPHIPRFKLQTLFSHLDHELDCATSEDSGTDDPS
jgi:hypothetical protein